MSHKTTISCGEFSVISKLTSLITRHGLRPEESDIYLTHHMDDENRETYYTLVGSDSVSTDDDEPKLERMWSALGMDDRGYRKFRNIGEVAEAVDQALSKLPPRPRLR